jgi:hypothetical protein
MAVDASLEYMFVCSKQRGKLDRRTEAAVASGTDMRDTAVACWRCCSLPIDRSIGRWSKGTRFKRLAKQFPRETVKSGQV